MDDLRVISDEFQDGVEGYYSNEFFVLKDGPIKKVEDLKGKVVATNAVGSAVDIASRGCCASTAWRTSATTPIEAAFPTMKALLAEKKADLIPAVPPFSLDPELRKSHAYPCSSRAGLGPPQLAICAARKRYREEPRGDDRLHGRYPASPAVVPRPGESRRGDANRRRRHKQPPELFAWLYTNKDYYHDLDVKPDLTACKPMSTWPSDLGIISLKVDVKAHSDLSLIEEAAKTAEVT